ncbi:hypothetical protein Tco_0842974 [Tanacetum coccineum]|uniref:Uncharacterized protein n=1 Tax=Tanacetum coccineum TaxID=301880 RepID=A0ABQ5B3J4_9ASTR
MVESLSFMVDKHIKEQVTQQVPKQVDASVRSYMFGHILHVHPDQPTTTSAREQQYQLTLAVRPRDQEDPHDDAHPKGENSEKQQKMSEYETYMPGESSSRQVNESDQGPSSLSNQEQVDDYDFWTDSYTSDDDEIPTKQVSQDIMEEVSLTINEAKLKKIADEMLRQRCTSRDEHQYHMDQMKNFLKTPALSLINQDLLYLNKGSSGLEKIVLSLYKFLAVIFNDDDIKEQTSRWVNKCVKKFNPYAQYGIIQVIKIYWELGHEHKFITEIVARRANQCIVSITEPDFKNLNKNDIKDMYLLIMNGKLGMESYQQKVNLTAPTISFLGIEKHKMLSIIHELVDLTKEEVEYLHLFEEEIEERLKHRNQMRRWEMYVNGRPLGPRRERPE